MSGLVSMMDGYRRASGADLVNDGGWPAGRAGGVDARSVRATTRSTAMETRVVNPGQRGLTSRLSGRC